MADNSERTLQLEVRREGDAGVVFVHGSADKDHVDEMRLALEGLAEQKVTPIILDLSDMDSICSMGLGAILAAHLKGRHYRAKIRLVNPKPAIRQLLEVARLTALFPIFRTVAEALAHVPRPRLVPKAQRSEQPAPTQAPPAP